MCIKVWWKPEAGFRQILVPSTKYQCDGHYLCTVHIPSIQYQYQYAIWLQYLRVAMAIGVGEVYFYTHRTHS